MTQRNRRNQARIDANRTKILIARILISEIHVIATKNGPPEQRGEATGRPKSDRPDVPDVLI